MGHILGILVSIIVWAAILAGIKSAIKRKVYFKEEFPIALFPSVLIMVCVILSYSDESSYLIFLLPMIIIIYLVWSLESTSSTEGENKKEKEKYLELLKKDEKIKLLREAYANGTITEKEYSEKTKILSQTLRKKAKNDIIQEDIDNLKKELEKLNELYKNGVLTQIEYNQKQEKYTFLILIRKFLFLRSGMQLLSVHFHQSQNHEQRFLLRFLRTFF